MLSSLKIENIALIEEAQIDFCEGFNCLTGETGAGKSIIIDSINCIIGEKTSRELIRTGEKNARVTAEFQNTGSDVAECLDNLGIEYERGDSLVISRTISRDGKNICRINGQSATVSMLKTLGKALLNIHGQHDSQDLLSPEKHIDFVDAVADDAAELELYRSGYAEIRELSDKIDKLGSDEAEKLKRIDLLDFQIKELTEANISAGEREALQKRKELCVNAKKLLDDFGKTLRDLNGGETADGARQLVKNGAELVKKHTELVPSLEAAAERLERIVTELEETASEIEDAVSGIGYSEREIDAIGDRLELLGKLSRKYGQTEEDMLLYLQNAKAERENIERSDELLAELEKIFNEKIAELKISAKNLSAIRRRAAAEFSEAICRELRFLDMPSVSFAVDRKATPFTENGIDEMQFLISANVGEPPKPLDKIASGGELSRIMLAIKTVLADKDKIGTLIFDEIDTGVSGSAAEKIAVKMKEISRTRQVICVTHLSQIAAYADGHFFIKKDSDGTRTYTHIRRLDRSGRIAELARISGGINIGDAQLRSAEEMLINAGYTE